MATQPASRILRMQYKGAKNFMTPYKEKLGKLNRNVAYELSSGRAIFNDGRVYGVTVVSFNPKRHKTNPQHNLSKSFESKNEAEAYVNQLRRKMKR